MSKRNPLLALDRALVVELIDALAEAQVMAMAVDCTPGVGDPFLRRACDLALRLRRQLTNADPSARVRQPNTNVAGTQAIWLSFVEVVQDALDRALYQERSYEMALNIAFTCNELPGRRGARDRVLAGDPRRDALIGARDRALHRARDLALAFAENLQEPWRPAYLLEFLARLLPANEREVFLEEHLASLAQATRSERWVYLLDLLATLPTTARVLHTTRAESARALFAASVRDGKVVSADSAISQRICSTRSTRSRGSSVRHWLESWSVPAANDEQPTEPTSPMPQQALPQSA